MDTATIVYFVIGAFACAISSTLYIRNSCVYVTFLDLCFAGCIGFTALFFWPFFILVAVMGFSAVMINSIMNIVSPWRKTILKK